MVLSEASVTGLRAVTVSLWCPPSGHCGLEVWFSGKSTGLLCEGLWVPSPALQNKYIINWKASPSSKPTSTACTCPCGLDLSFTEGLGGEMSVSNS